MFSFRTAARSFALIAFVSIALAACGDDEPSGPDLPAAGTARVTIDVDGDDTTFTGEAEFEASSEGFGMVIGAEGPSAAVLISFARENNARPGVGNIPIEDVSDTQLPPANNIGSQVLIFADGEMAELYSTGGTMRVTRSTAESFAGTFTMTATGCIQCDTTPIEFDAELDGAFNATAGSMGQAVQARVKSLRFRPSTR